jgi:RNA polymerase sigma-70 factor, ECF subfamily
LRCSRPRYRDLGRPFLAFVYRIAAHKVADAYRSAAGNAAELVAQIPDAADTADDPETHLLQAEMASRMATLLQTLPERQREVLRLRIVVGLSAEQTGKV